jgi:ssDNA-binding Zn-finger/Zn-ribbon topoisomerase 1
MSRDFFDPTPEEQNVVLVDTATLRKAERLIESCENCNLDAAEIPFDNILDRLTGSDPSVTDYVLETPAKCPNCRHEIVEKL